MKILHFIDSLNYGGAEALLMSYIPLLTSYDHLVVTLNGPNVYPRAGYQYHELNMGTPFQFFKTVKKLRRIIKDEDVSIIHSHSFWTNIISRRATPGNLKLFNHYHFADYDTMPEKWGVKRMMMIDKLIGHRQLHRVAVSSYIGQVLTRIFKNKPVTVLPNFIQPSLLANETRNIRVKGTLNIVAVGNCNVEKDYETVLDAFELLKDEQIKLDVYGGGDMLEYYRNEVSRRGLTKITFFGLTAGIRERLSTYDLFISSSLSESFGIAVLEAIAEGLPILVSDIPAYREITPATTNFFKPGNSQELARKLKYISNNDIIIDQQGYNSVLKKYSSDSFTAKLNDLYYGA